MKPPPQIEQLRSASPTSTKSPPTITTSQTSDILYSLQKAVGDNKFKMATSSHPLLTTTTNINGESNNDHKEEQKHNQQYSLSSVSPSPPNHHKEIPRIPKPRSPSRSKSKSRPNYKSKNNKKRKSNSALEKNLIDHVNMNMNHNMNDSGLQSPSNDIMDSIRSDHFDQFGFPDETYIDHNDHPNMEMVKSNATMVVNSPNKHKRHRSSNNNNHINKKVYHSYYLEHRDDDNMQYSYFHSRIKDKLVWYQDIEKLLPSTIPGQFIYALLNMIFSSDLYYSFHRYSFDDGFKTEHRMDDFFTSRRVLSIQNTIPDILPSILWYKIIKYEPTPYKSMCYYQYVRQKDADKTYKIPVILGYFQWVLIVILTFDFCYHLYYQYEENKSFQFFNFNVMKLFGDNWSYHDLLLFKPWDNTLNMLCYLLIFITLLHILLILIIWRIIWFLHFKIYDWKRRISSYLSRRRKKEIAFIDNLYNSDKNKIQQEYKYRIYYKINPQSYLYYKRNGELFISLLKWLNVIEFEQDLDFFTTSKRNWYIITFALHKYFAILLYSFILLFGINLITSILLFFFTLSYWIHCIELYSADHHNLSSKSNQDYNPSKSELHRFCCNTIMKILKLLFWPGILFYVVLAYAFYTIHYHTNYFLVIWAGISPIWLIAYSVLTRGYRRIYIFNGLALFMLYFVFLNFYLLITHSFMNHYYISIYTTPIFICLFIFCFHLSLQFEIHRAILFPQMSQEFKRDETAQNKFGLDVNGAKLYTFVQYASLYFKKTVSSHFNNKHHTKENSHHHFTSSDNYNYDGIDGFVSKWYNKWYIKRPIDAIRIPKPRYPFVYK